VTGALDRQQQVLLARERHGMNDVIDICAPHDERWMPVDHRVEDGARRIVPLVAWREQLTG
jgi:hypothetical protein